MSSTSDTSKSAPVTLKLTPTLARIILEQLEASGVDITQSELFLQLHQQEPAHYQTHRDYMVQDRRILSFLTHMTMPLAPAEGFGGQNPHSVYAFLKSVGAIVTQSTEQASDEIRLNLQMLNDIANRPQTNTFLARFGTRDSSQGGHGPSA